MRWGCGHGVGLLAVFGIILAVDKENDEALRGKLQTVAGVVVGSLMLGLGLYGIGVGGGIHRTASEYRDLSSLDGGVFDGDAGGGDRSAGERASLLASARLRSTANAPARATATPRDEERGSADGAGDSAKKYDPLTRTALAVTVGVVHGAAGPGAVLGVLPAVSLRDPALACGYFGGFLASTVCTMGAFAALYGKLTKALGDAYGDALRRRLMLFSSLCCAVVGVVWIALSLSGVNFDAFGT